MPMWNNITGADLYLDEESGPQTVRRILPGTTFHGSEGFYKRYSTGPINDRVISRSTDGFISISTVGTSPNAINTVLNGMLQADEIQASTADSAINSLVTAGTFYSAFGSITWNDGPTGTLHSVFFAVLGDGDHGGSNEATFTFTAPNGSPSQQPQAIGSRIDAGNGTITISMTSTGTFNPIVEIIYEMSREGLRLGDMNPLLERPRFVKFTEYVVAGDVNENYIASSINEIKSIKTFLTGSKAGDPAQKITFYYKTANAATPKPTHSVEEKTFVLTSDLP